MARPKLPAGAAKTAFLHIPVTPEQHRIVMEAAARESTEGFASWARAVLLGAASGQGVARPRNKRPKPATPD